MQRLARLQLLGPLLLFFVVLAAEWVAYALTQTPSSILLWYLNLEVFGLFRTSRMLMGALGAYPFSLLAIVGPLALIAIAGFACRRNLLAAIASNLSLIYLGYVLFSWQFWHSMGPPGRQASLSVVWAPSEGNFYLVATLVLASLISFMISHFVYLRVARGRA